MGLVAEKSELCDSLGDNVWKSYSFYSLTHSLIYSVSLSLSFQKSFATLLKYAEFGNLTVIGGNGNYVYHLL
jgi:hypothetical protein